GGMEYPTLITTGGPWYGPPGVMGIELVTIHEFGHQYFYGMLASDEVTWPFLDEGMNSYAEAEGLGAQRGEASMLDLLGLHVSDEAVGAVLSAKRAVDAPVAQPAYAFTGPDYGALVYARTAAIFATIDHVYGKELGAKAIGRYARRARFRHPVPDDLLTSYEEVLGPDVRATLREALFAKGWVDYRVEGVQSTKVGANAGVFDRDGKRETVAAPTGKEGDYEGWALVFRHGTLRFPVDVEFVLEDGTTQRTTWDGEGDFARVPYRGSLPLKGATVDPDHKILVDRTFTNNFAMASGSGSTKRTFERTLYGSELLFSLVGP
ncbi:MAG TPA: M1 family aminopeptidase, partial [Polyangiaceae bacterium]